MQNFIIGFVNQFGGSPQNINDFIKDEKYKIFSRRRIDKKCDCWRLKIENFKKTRN